jgi:carbon-monoxide dehydrogenase large subunit
MLITGCYDIPAAEVTIFGARTHKVPTGPYRGAGRPDAAYMLERLVDDAARALRMDRLELRRRNLIHSFPHRTPLGHVYDSGDYERCLDLALELRDSDGLDPADEGWIRGEGAAVFVERGGGRWESAEIDVLSDGRVLVHSSASPHGQGHETTFAQIAAQRMGIVLDQVLLRFGDSSTSPPGVGTFGSRSVAMAGSAIAVAIDDLIDRLRQLAARLLDVETRSVVWECGSARADGRSVSLRELAAAAARLGRGVDAVLKTSARFESGPVFSSGAYAAVVEIQRATGQLRVLRLAAVDDAGTVINPLLAHGQVIGGVVQGLGECLVEEAVYDEIGQARSATLMDYGLLTSADVPPIITGEVSSPTPLNPLGAKGIGEGGAIGTLPAVANAVVDALGGTHVNPPFTAEKLWRALVAESTA